MSLQDQIAADVAAIPPQNRPGPEWSWTINPSTHCTVPGATVTGCTYRNVSTFTPTLAHRDPHEIMAAVAHEVFNQKAVELVPSSDGRSWAGVPGWPGMFQAQAQAAGIEKLTVADTFSNCAATGLGLPVQLADAGACPPTLATLAVSVT